MQDFKLQLLQIRLSGADQTIKMFKLDGTTLQRSRVAASSSTKVLIVLLRILRLLILLENGKHRKSFYLKMIIFPLRVI